MSDREKREPPPGDDAGSERDAERDPDSGSAWIEPFFTDSGLWSVLAVVVLTLATLGASVLVLAVQDRSRSAMAALVLAGGMTVFALESDLRRRRLGSTGRLLLVVWALVLAGGFAFLRFAPA